MDTLRWKQKTRSHLHPHFLLWTRKHFKTVTSCTFIKTKCISISYTVHFFGQITLYFIITGTSHICAPLSGRHHTETAKRSHRSCLPTTVNSRGTRLNAVAQAQTPLKDKQKTTLSGGLLFVTSVHISTPWKILIFQRFRTIFAQITSYPACMYSVFYVRRESTCYGIIFGQLFQSIFFP